MPLGGSSRPRKPTTGRGEVPGGGRALGGRRLDRVEDQLHPTVLAPLRPWPG